MSRTVIDVVVTWGASTLHVSRRTTPCRFWIGEDAHADCVVPREALSGSACVELLVPHRGGVGLVVSNGVASAIFDSDIGDPVDLIEQHAQPYRDAFAERASRSTRMRTHASGSVSSWWTSPRALLSAGRLERRASTGG